MASIRFKAANAAGFANAAPAYLMGKNGFITELGTVPVLITGVTKADLDSNIIFTIRGLNDLLDENLGVHLLDTGAYSNTYSFMGASLPDRTYLQRNSHGWSFDSTIALANNATNNARFSYNVVDGSLEGLLVEPFANNTINNSSALGSVAGSPGTVPTGWLMTGSTNAVTRYIIGSGTEDGIPYVDVRYAGTPSTTGTKVISSMISPYTPASNGETWLTSFYVKLSNGSVANTTTSLGMRPRYSNETVILNSGAVTFTPTSSNLKSQLVSNVYTISAPGTGLMDQVMLLSYTIANPVDITLRLGAPQLIKSNIVTTPIITTSLAVERANDIAYLNVINGTYNFRVTRLSGNTDHLSTVVSDGRFYIPTSNSPVQLVSILSGPNVAPQSGTQQITYKVIPNESETNLGDVAYVDPYIPVTSNIITYFTNNNTLKISNPYENGSDLYSKIESPPFYGSLYQTLSVNNFSQKSMYVSGTTLKSSKLYNVFGLSGSYTANIALQPEDKKFIKVYLDGTPTDSSYFTWDNRANITVDLSNSFTELLVQYSKYTVPTIEIGDNVSVIFNNIYSIINSSYLLNTSRYNSIVSANNIFRIYPSENLRFNATGFIGTNINPDPFGILGNVNTTANTFTFDYNSATYPGNFQLANNFVYKLMSGAAYSSLPLPDGRTLYDVSPGMVSVRARNVNPGGRKSPYSTANIEIEDIILPGVQNLTVEEDLYYDTTQGVASRATVSFDHNPAKEILGYELSYKIEAENTPSTNFITVQLPVTGVDSTGRLNYVINNIDKGRTSGVNYLVVRITPINNSITGVTKQLIHNIIGKTALPDNVQSFNFAQNNNTLVLFWSFSKNADNSIKDLDLQEIEIRRVQGQLTTPEQFLAAWNGAQKIATIAIPTTNHSFNIESYGLFTYLIKTRDTSRNESLTVSGLSLTLQRPPNISAFKTWSEDDPGANNSVTFMTNENYAEYYWPSFANSDNGGLYYAVDDPITPGAGPSTLTENANGTSSGFSVGSNSTDLFSGANAFYQTSVRDLGRIIKGKISTDINVYSILASTWLSMRENLVSGVSDVSPSANVFWDSGSFIGQMLQSNGATYSVQNKTLISNESSYGNVYAIWNSGQFAGDISNANSFALIAGVINANALALGATYYASGTPSGSNLLANLTTSAGTYQLVNLKQWGDQEGLGNWQGPDGLVSYNLELRYSTSNVYFPVDNANVNVISFSSSSAGDFAGYQSGEMEFRWFQLRTWIINLNPALASAVYDKFRYTADLTIKTYTTTVNVTTNPTFVDLTQQGFKSTPGVSLTAIVDTPLRVNNTFPSYSSINSNSTQANITVYSNVGAFVANTLVTFTATGH